MSTDFDWLKEYGPHWQPGSLAFWMAPDTAEDMAAWLQKYRPDVLPRSEPVTSQAFNPQQITGLHALAQQQLSAGNLYLNGYHQSSGGQFSLAAALGLINA